VELETPQFFQSHLPEAPQWLSSILAQQLTGMTMFKSPVGYYRTGDAKNVLL